MQIGDRMRAARERCGMTQSELAAKLGVSAPTVTLWENQRNRRAVNVKYLEPIAAALNIRVGELLGESPPSEQPQLVAEGPAEIQLLRLFRLMPEKLKLVQLAQFVQCAGLSDFNSQARNNVRGYDAPVFSGEGHESR
jgi:transcriptional regulator with XRE-family HTH domain